MNAQVQVLVIAYVITAAAMLAGMRLMRGGKSGYLRSPLYSVISLFLGVMLWNQLRRHVLPPLWGLTHPALLYYGALGLYALFGFAIGMLAGRATRQRPRTPELDPPG